MNEREMGVTSFGSYATSTTYLYGAGVKDAQGEQRGKLERGQFSIVDVDDKVVGFSCWGNRKLFFFPC